MARIKLQARSTTPKGILPAAPSAASPANPPFGGPYKKQNDQHKAAWIFKPLKTRPSVPVVCATVRWSDPGQPGKRLHLLPPTPTRRTTCHLRATMTGAVSVDHQGPGFSRWLKDSDLVLKERAPGTALPIPASVTSLQPEQHWNFHPSYLFYDNYQEVKWGRRSNVCLSKSKEAMVAPGTSL